MILKKDDWHRELRRIVAEHGALLTCAHAEDLDSASRPEPLAVVRFPKGTPESVSELMIAEMRREAHEVTGIVFQLERSKDD